MLYMDLFEKGYIERSPVTGISIPSDMAYLRRIENFNRDAIEAYYLSRTFATKNTNIISRYVEHINTSLNYDVFRYSEYLNNKTDSLSRLFKFTSDIEKGIVHPPHFFGNDGEEIIFSDSDGVDLKETMTNWKTSKAISVLKHPRNDTKLLLPQGGDNGGRGGLSVIQIDPVKLAIKYREFVKEQFFNEQTDGVVLNKNHFVMRYVLPTMIEDITDHSFLNKVMDTFYGRSEVTPKFKHRFKIFEPERQIQRYIDQTLDTVSNKKMDFIAILHNINMIFNVNAADLLTLPEFSGTRQSKWALMASRLEHMCFIYDVARYKEMSKKFINDWKLAVKRLERDGGFQGQFSYQTTKELEEYMYKIKNM